ncbi:MAG: HEAT repeat domain-containing protein [Halobacteriota archaeon]
MAFDIAPYVTLIGGILAGILGALYVPYFKQFVEARARKQELRLSLYRDMVAWYEQCISAAENHGKRFRAMGFSPYEPHKAKNDREKPPVFGKSILQAVSRPGISRADLRTKLSDLGGSLSEFQRNFVDNSIYKQIPEDRENRQTLYWLDEYGCIKAFYGDFLGALEYNLSRYTTVPPHRLLTDSEAQNLTLWEFRFDLLRKACSTFDSAEDKGKLNKYLLDKLRGGAPRGTLVTPCGDSGKNAKWCPTCNRLAETAQLRYVGLLRRLPPFYAIKRDVCSERKCDKRTLLCPFKVENVGHYAERLLKQLEDDHATTSERVKLGKEEKHDILTHLATIFDSSAYQWSMPEDTKYDPLFAVLEHELVLGNTSEDVQAAAATAVAAAMIAFESMDTCLVIDLLKLLEYTAIESEGSPSYKPTEPSAKVRHAAAVAVRRILATFDSAFSELVLPYIYRYLELALISEWSSGGIGYADNIPVKAACDGGMDRVGSVGHAMLNVVDIALKKTCNTQTAPDHGLVDILQGEGPYPNEQLALLSVLGRIGKSPAEPLLTNVQPHLPQALGYLGEAAIAPLLMVLNNSADSKTRCAAATALGNIGGASDVAAALKEVSTNETKDLALKTAAQAALAAATICMMSGEVEDAVKTEAPQTTSRIVKVGAVPDGTDMTATVASYVQSHGYALKMRVDRDGSDADTYRGVATDNDGVDWGFVAHAFNSPAETSSGYRLVVNEYAATAGYTIVTAGDTKTTLKGQQNNAVVISQDVADNMVFVFMGGP